MLQNSNFLNICCIIHNSFFWLFRVLINNVLNISHDLLSAACDFWQLMHFGGSCEHDSFDLHILHIWRRVSWFLLHHLQVKNCCLQWIEIWSNFWHLMHWSIDLIEINFEIFDIFFVIINFFLIRFVSFCVRTTIFIDECILSIRDSNFNNHINSRINSMFWLKISIFFFNNVMSLIDSKIVISMSWIKNSCHNSFLWITTKSNFFFHVVRFSINWSAVLFSSTMKIMLFFVFDNSATII